MQARAILVALLLAPVLCAQQPAYTVSAVPLPGATPSGISMDYIAYDPMTDSVWVPAGSSGKIDVIEAKTLKVRSIDTATKEVTREGRTRVAGASSVSIGEGLAFVGSRADASVCAYDAKTLEKKRCGTVGASPDGVVWVGPTKEIWVTTPGDHSIRVLDAATLRETARIETGGETEGYAVDASRGRFYTNLEDKALTLAIDVKTKKIVATWKPGCAEDGARGLAIDEKRDQLFVACTDHLAALDTKSGAVLSTLDTGAGVDNLDYSPESHRVYAGASRAAKLTVASVDAHGKLALFASVTTPQGVRNPAVAKNGSVFLIHPAGSEIVVATPK